MARIRKPQARTHAVEVGPAVDPSAPLVPTETISDAEPDLTPYRDDDGVPDDAVGMGDDVGATEPVTGAAEAPIVDAVVPDEVIASFADTAPSGGIPIVEETPEKGKKGKKDKPVINRAEAGVVGGPMLDGVLAMVSGLLGTRLHPHDLLMRQHAAISAEATAKGLPAPPPGLPVDINFEAIKLGQFGNAAHRGLSVVLELKDGKPSPKRVSVGLATLNEDESPLLQNAPREGQCWVEYMPATIGMAAAYNLATVPDQAIERVMKVIAEHEDTIRLLYALGLLGYFAVTAYQDGAKAPAK